jgi:hypothetical protein
MRNGIKRASAAEGVEETKATEQEGEDAPNDGGSPGIQITQGHSPTSDPTATVVHTAADKIVGSAKDAASERMPPVERFSVVGDHRVLFNGMTYTVRHGKIVDAQSHDLKLLKRQGVRLEKLPADAG